MFERMTDRSRRVLVLAQEEARLLNHSFIGTEHILLGVIHEGGSIGWMALAQFGVTLEGVRAEVERMLGQSAAPPGGDPPFTPRAKKVLELALREALMLGHSYVGPEHIVLGLVREGEGVAGEILVHCGADLGKLRQAVITILSGSTARAPAATFDVVAEEGWSLRAEALPADHEAALSIEQCEANGGHCFEEILGDDDWPERCRHCKLGRRPRVAWSFSDGRDRSW